MSAEECDKEKMQAKPLPSHTQKVEWKGSTLLGALPAVMVSFGDMEHPNIITVAWTGIICSQPPMTYIGKHFLKRTNKQIQLKTT